MRKFIKGFTLIELIIVMAILSIIMLGIMQMMKPIRATYVDSTYYESQRTTQNGISKYIGESVRYATKLTAYKSSGSVNISTAISRFKSDAGYDASTDGPISVIVIDNSTNYTFNNHEVHGRVLRNKDGSESETRMALGEAYYGKYNYSINLEPTGLKKNTDPTTGAVKALKCGGFRITVSSLLPSSLKKAESDGKNNTEDLTDYECVMTQGEAVCRNLAQPINGYSNVLEIATAYGDGYTFNTTQNGMNTYIVFTLPIKDND